MNAPFSRSSSYKINARESFAGKNQILFDPFRGRLGGAWKGAPDQDNCIQAYFEKTVEDGLNAGGMKDDSC
jgi:hypothetical protein